MEDDVKIYGAVSKQSQETASVIEIMQAHRTNGNIGKAGELGILLANFELDLDKEVAPKFLKPDIVCQIKVMLLFVAEATLQMQVFEPILATTAINAMYDEVQRSEPGLYRNISDGIAYSFYYTDIRDGGDIEKNIGETFAMLCSAKDNESFIETGKHLYKRAVEVVCGEIQKADFKLI